MRWLETRWYQKRPAPLFLRPLEWLYRTVSDGKRQGYVTGSKEVFRPRVPVIIVGNITVGGTGKTPVVLWLIEKLKAAGYKPGVVSRGYGAKAPRYPYAVTKDTLPAEGGDEPCMLVRRSGCPLVVDPDRPAAVQYLLEQFDCDLVISDDGLQHYALGRDIELVVIDGRRGVGNGHCLPAGPLREPVERLDDVDFVISNGEGENGFDAISMGLAPTAFVALDGSKRIAVDQWQEKRVHAVAGIGNPARFFDTLRLAAGIEPLEHPFADHHPYVLSDLQFSESLPLVMTEKDAVKVSHLKNLDGWYLEVSAELPVEFETALLNKLEQITYTVESDG